MIDWAELSLFLFVTARMSGLILFNPILGRRNIPGIVRSGMILWFSVFAMSITEQPAQMPVGMIDLAVRMLLEIGLGFLLGMIVNFFFYIPQMTGSIVDLQMGLTMNQIYDPGSQANMSVNGVLLNVLMTLLFFAGNGQHTLIRIFLTSGDVISYGAASFGPEVYGAALNLFAQCTLMGIKMCMPILAAELIAQVGMGVLMKVIPQINVFAINIELKVIVGLGLIFLLIAPFSEYLLGVEVTMLNSLSQMLQLVGTGA